MKHYVYRITNKETKKYYYGSRSTKRNPLNDIGIYYFSSSSDKEFIKDQKLNPENYKYKVVYIFSTRKDAIELEIKLHKKFNVGVNESFYNRSKQMSNRFDRTGIYHTSETKLKISESNKGKNKGFKHSEETKSLMSKNHYNCSKENNPFYNKSHTHKTRLKISESNKGKKPWNYGKNIPISETVKENLLKYSKNKPSDETKLKMSKSKCQKIKIFDNNNNLKYTSDIGFIKFCEINNLPCSLFQASYRNNGKPLLQTTKAVKRIAKPEYIKYKGWYAIKD